MQIRKLATASSLLVTLALTGTIPSTALAQQVDDANARKEAEEAVEFLRLQTDRLRLRTNEELPNTPNVGTTTTGGDILGIMIDGETDVPEEEHLETWVSRALTIYAQTDDEESRLKQREEITKGLNKIFDLRHQQRVKELRELEARVQKLKSTLDQRAASKTDIVKKRLDYLIREADGLGWGDGIPAPKRSGLTGARFSTETQSGQPVSEVSGEEAIVPQKVPH